jgi:hypothetical protein
MNSLFVVLSLFSGPGDPGIVPRLDAVDAVYAYYFNDALVDAALQDQVIEIRGRVGGIKRVEPPSPPIPPSESVAIFPRRKKVVAPAPAPAPVPAVADPVLAYDVWIPVSLRLRGDGTDLNYVRCRFPTESRQKLAMLPVPNSDVIIRGRCRGVKRVSLIEVGPNVDDSPVLEIVDCQIVEGRPAPEPPAPKPE